MNRSVPLKAVLAAVLGLALLAGAFFGGMAFENHRISNEFKEAFGGMGSDEDFDTDVDDTVIEGEGEGEGEAAAEPVELKRGEPHVVSTFEGGEATVTLLGSTITDASGVYGGDYTRGWYSR